MYSLRLSGTVRSIQFHVLRPYCISDSCSEAIIIISVRRLSRIKPIDFHSWDETVII